MNGVEKIQTCLGSSKHSAGAFQQIQGQMPGQATNGDAANSSPASSSRSYRRIKELKNSINSKKMGKPPAPPPPIPSNPLNHTDNEEDYLKKSLMTSFTKRRDRKGSLPEINAERAMMMGNADSSFVGTVVNLDDDEATGPHPSDLYFHPLTSTQETFATLNDDSAYCPTATNRRTSRKSAFVLEVFRTSMFRSKSLTDLNSSLVKSENYATMANTSHLSSGGYAAVQFSNKNLANNPTTSLNRLCVPINEKYS